MNPALPATSEGQKPLRIEACPFCGGKATAGVMINCLGDCFVSCDNFVSCCRGPMRRSKSEAIAAWNSRVPATPPSERSERGAPRP